MLKTLSTSCKFLAYAYTRISGAISDIGHPIRSISCTATFDLTNQSINSVHPQNYLIMAIGQRWEALTIKENFDGYWYERLNLPAHHNNRLK